jgi:hypothetical protein
MCDELFITLIIKDPLSQAYLSYQASLAYNPKEFLGVITNWRRCRGEEIEAQLPWETTRSSFDDRQSLDIIWL